MRRDTSCMNGVQNISTESELITDSLEMVCH